MQFHDDDLLIEITPLGDWQRVAVLHVGSRTEVVVHGPLAASSEYLIALGRRKLARRLARAAARAGAAEPGLWV
ncbi:MAG: hypothetical protein EA356_01525 [Geminicoccaceae bacterium]|nr:MAG: hypothetical protein EA356_01525 [Geminicoccaceae bacterium]